MHLIAIKPTFFYEFSAMLSLFNLSETENVKLSALSTEGVYISSYLSVGGTKPNIFLFVSAPTKLKHNCH